MSEAGSALVRRLLRSGTAATSRISEVELASAVARRHREGTLTARERDRILRALDADIAALLIVELTPAVSARARALLATHSLRAGDAIQLASSLYLQEEIGRAIRFVGFDTRLLRAASNEGLLVG